jgi:ribose transport system substrate-binding protein
MEDGVRSKRFALLLAFCLVLLGGCQGQRKKTIAVIPKGTSHLFWLSVQAGAMAAGKEFNVDVLWNGPSQETEYSRQIQILDSMIARNVDGIAVAASERKALLQSLDRAASQKIPVVVFDSGVDGENYLTFLATDNYEAGQMAGRELGRLLNGKGEVAMVMHAPGSASTMDRERGFQDVIAQEFSGIRIVATQFGLSDRAKARAAAENILTAHPRLDGIFASSEPSSVGTALAVDARGLTRKLKFVAFDSSDSMIEDLKDGTIDGMVVQDPFQMGFESVRILVDRLGGATPPRRIDLSARVVTKPDLEKPEVRELLSPDLKKYLETQ